MASVTLTAYEVTLHRRRSKDENEVLGDFNNGKDFLFFLEAEISKWSYEGNLSDTRIINDTKSNRLLRLRRDSLKRVGRTIQGIVETGEYGVEADIINDRGQFVTKRKKNEAPMLPFFFMFYIPKDRAAGIFIIQKFKQYGAFSIFKKSIKDEVRSGLSEYIVEFSQLVSTKLLEAFLNGGVIGKISFKKHKNNKIITAPGDNTPLLDSEDYYTEYNIITKRNRKARLGKRLIAFTRGNDNLNDLVAIKEFEFNEVSAVIKLDNHQRTINLTKLDNIGAFFDITDEVTFDDITGLPDFKLVENESQKVLADIIEVTNI